MNNANIVAHRGYAEKYPENTIRGFRAAIDAGCLYLECDIQLSKDMVPVVVHDASLKRTGSRDINVLDTPWAGLQTYCVGEQLRFEKTFLFEPLPSLASLVKLLQTSPNVFLFAELKEESLSSFGANKMLHHVLEILAPIKDRVAIISYNAEVLQLAKEQYALPIGWVLTEYTEESASSAHFLSPDYLICNYKKIDGKLWSGNWQWFLYDIPDPELAWQWVEKGVKFIEAMDIGQLLTDGRFSAKRIA